MARELLFTMSQHLDLQVRLHTMRWNLVLISSFSDQILSCEYGGILVNYAKYSKAIQRQYIVKPFPNDHVQSEVKSPAFSPCMLSSDSLASVQTLSGLPLDSTLFNAMLKRIVKIRSENLKDYCHDQYRKLFSCMLIPKQVLGCHRCVIFVNFIQCMFQCKSGTANLGHLQDAK